MHVLVTGAAGFIGSTLTLRLLARGDSVHGIDNLNDYYDVRLKQARLARLTRHPRFSFARMDIVERKDMAELFAGQRFDAVMHLAAQAGVRYSIENPAAYIDANLVGFGNIVEGARRSQVGHLVFASSSSVYGANTKLPFSEHDSVDHPVSLYAATKKANELMAHSYAHLYRLPCTGLRFFTVYGPWGRPDMALFKFTASIIAGAPIPVFNRGDMVRDFTYVDDIVEGVMRVLDQPAAPDAAWNSAAPDPAMSNAPYRIFNIGNNRPVQLLRYIEVLEQCLGRKAQLELLPMQAGDVPATSADVSALEQAVGYRPQTTIEQGVARFVQWYREYYAGDASTATGSKAA
jgi:UDP-glucuronate 4-epimerase